MAVRSVGGPRPTAGRTVHCIMEISQFAGEPGKDSSNFNTTEIVVSGYPISAQATTIDGFPPVTSTGRIQEDQGPGPRASTKKDP